MRAFSRILFLFAMPIAATGSHAQAPPPPAPKALPPGASARPPGSLIRCKDGRWAPAGADDSWCGPHGGVRIRYPRIDTAPPAKARPEGKSAQQSPSRSPTDPRALPAEAIKAATTSPGRSASARAGAAAPPRSEPVRVSTVCKDGTVLAGTNDRKFCDAHGGVLRVTPIPKAPRR